MAVETLPTSAEVVSGTQTNAEQKVDFASLLDFLLSKFGTKSGQGPEAVASAATLDLDAVVETRDIVISGTTAITAVTIEAGKVFRWRASGAFTWTNNAAIVTQTGANITCAAGDSGLARATAANTVELLCFTRASTVAAVVVPTRQTVISGPVDSNGQSAFVGATGSTTVTATATLIATAANGFATTGQVDRIGSIVNPSWTGLSTNGTMHLYLDIDSAGVITPGSGTLAPTYQQGGTYSITSNQFTFNWNEMVGKVGNGAAAVQTHRVYVGEVTVAGGVVTAIIWYALNRKFVSAWTATLPTSSVQISANHNIGNQEFLATLEAECTSNDNGFVVGQRIDLSMAGLTSTYVLPMTIAKNRNSVTIGTANGSGQPFIMPPAGGGAAAGLTNANWKYRWRANGIF